MKKGCSNKQDQATGGEFPIRRQYLLPTFAFGFIVEAVVARGRTVLERICNALAWSGGAALLVGILDANDHQKRCDAESSTTTGDTISFESTHEFNQNTKQSNYCDIVSKTIEGRTV